MKNRIRKKFSKTRTKVLALLVVVASVGTFSFSENLFEVSKNIEIFNSLYRELNIYYVDDTNPGELMKTGIDAMLKSLDPYTVYYPESKVEDYRFLSTGQYGGIGAIISRIGDEVTVMETYEGFSAQKAGLTPGDIILAVDGEATGAMDQEEISGLLKGQAGTGVQLTVKKVATKATEEVSLDREDVKVPDVPWSGMLDEKTGYIKLTGFTKTASRDVKAALLELKKEEGFEQLILDLRGNGGGLLREAVNILNIFVPKGIEVVRTRGKIEDWNRVHTTLSEPVAPELPLTVLVDGNSASASEIVAGTLQDLDRAVVVGETTFGKGLVQQPRDIAYKSKMKLTVAKYYIPSGRCIQKLDYSNKVGGLAEEVPDSLITKFYTSNGREVYDGRGVKPEIAVLRPEASNILSGMVSNFIVFQYITDYVIAHPEIADAQAYKMTDQEYENFMAYALAKEFEYNTLTEKFYKDLEDVAKEERYFDGAESEFAQLFDKIKPKKESDLVKFREQIQGYMENEIVARYYYQTGRILNQLANDEFVDKAIDCLATNYDAILAGTN